MFLTAGRMSILASVCMATGTCAFAGRVLKVGEGCEFARPSQAAAVARDGDPVDPTSESSEHKPPFSFLGPTTNLSLL